MKSAINTGTVKVLRQNPCSSDSKRIVLFYSSHYTIIIADVTIGNWKGSVPIPDQSFEIREQWLHGEDRTLFVQLLRRMLCWMPEERLVAEELAFDEFLMQPQATAFSGASTETLT